MHLLGDGKRHARETRLIGSVAMHLPEPRQRSLPVSQHIDAGRALEKRGPHERQGVEGWERLDRTGDHFEGFALFCCFFFGAGVGLVSRIGLIRSLSRKARGKAGCGLSGFVAFWK